MQLMAGDEVAPVEPEDMVTRDFNPSNVGEPRPVDRGVLHDRLVRRRAFKEPS